MPLCLGTWNGQGEGVQIFPTGLMLIRKLVRWHELLISAADKTGGYTCYVSPGKYGSSLHANRRLFHVQSRPPA